jgi:hypothetical protein
MIAPRLKSADGSAAKPYCGGRSTFSLRRINATSGERFRKRVRYGGWLAAAAMFLASLAIPCRAADELVYRSPTNVEFRVTRAGLSYIGIGDRELASGGWSAFNAESWFKDGGSHLVKSEPKGESSIQILSDHHARVRQAGGDLVCIYDYTFDGEDVLISTRIENSAMSPMNIVGFSGLTFYFDKLPTGLMPVAHITYFQFNGVQTCHPGYWQPIGGTYAEDDSVGVGTSPWNAGLTRTLTLWDYTDWNPGKRETIPRRLLRYFVVSPVPPRGAATFDFVLRVSPNLDWKHLLGKYREYFQQTFGPVRYKLDARFIATDYLNGGPQAISPTNPDGFYSSFRRIDGLAGAMSFCDHTIPALTEENGQGIIVWGQGGENPRGAMYRPDFDVLPPGVEANWPIIARRYKEAGLKLGVAARPRDIAVRLDWNHDEVISINADDPGHREMLWRRFQRMMNLGCSLFYLDSFGDELEDVKLMEFLREKLGPNVLTFVEHPCDAIMPFSGGFAETTIPEGVPGNYRLTAGEDNWKIYQWLCPGAQMAARFRPGPPDASMAQTPDAWMFERAITPLLPVNDFRWWLPGMQQLQQRYVTQDGQWK